MKYKARLLTLHNKCDKTAAIMTKAKSPPQCWLLGMLEKDILGSGHAVLMLLDLDYRKMGLS